MLVCCHVHLKQEGEQKREKVCSRLVSSVWKTCTGPMDTRSRTKISAAAVLWTCGCKSGAGTRPSACPVPGRMACLAAGLRPLDRLVA